MLMMYIWSAQFYSGDRYFTQILLKVSGKLDEVVLLKAFESFLA
jgi:hypothetical protein